MVSHVQSFTPSYLVHRSLPSGSGFSCVAPLASLMPPGVMRRHEGGTLSSSPLGWELDRCPHPLEHQVITGDSLTFASHPLGYPKFRENGSQPSVNQPQISATRWCASSLLPCCCHRRLKLIALAVLATSRSDGVAASGVRNTNAASARRGHHVLRTLCGRDRAFTRGRSRASPASRSPPPPPSSSRT